MAELFRRSSEALHAPYYSQSGSINKAQKLLRVKTKSDTRTPTLSGHEFVRRTQKKIRTLLGRTSLFPGLCLAGRANILESKSTSRNKDKIIGQARLQGSLSLHRVRGPAGMIPCQVRVWHINMVVYVHNSVKIIALETDSNSHLLLSVFISQAERPFFR